MEFIGEVISPGKIGIVDITKEKRTIICKYINVEENKFNLIKGEKF